ncbi:cell division protein FtsA [Campylobacter blaseri]|uniref:Cell division protein FtsA n=1 Tax=Campylobacter blaseri TaxID=2042961 RepID=A0A2P8QZN1_9BACT|nr:cell division protein FtsA [Campylobacter blaseri]PSM51707.1 cell division protein FtsA [Campylobacter blaseri]PSM53497.1 cell division protein FtsA [Campylobacter blaseri]QKF86302.1 cell division protein FtsA [Campylobacter blaseri]
MNNSFILGLDIGSVDITAAIAKVGDDGFSISGIGKVKTSGLRRGAVTNIEQASISIRKAVLEAQKSAGAIPDHIIVSISGACAKSEKSVGIVSVPSQEITLNEIKRAMQMAEDNTILEKDQIILHVLPYDFKVDGQEHIEDPIGMSGSRLEVCTHVITANENSVKNLIKATQMAGLNIDNMVLAGYASAISTINKDEKSLGVAVMDLGGSTCDIVIHLGNSIIYNYTLPIGSSSITSDLSHALNTPLSSAEELKLNYSKIVTENQKELNIPTMGESSSKHTVSLDIVTNVIYARIEETLMLLAKKLESSEHMKHLGAGIVLTGGMSKLDDIRNLTSAIFDNIPVRVAKPRKVEGLYEISEDPSNSCVVGLCLYGAGEFTPYEVDSNGELKYKENNSIKSNHRIANQKNEKISNSQINDEKKSSPEEGLTNLPELRKNDKNSSFFVKLWNRLTQLF